MKFRETFKFLRQIPEFRESWKPSPPAYIIEKFTTQNFDTIIYLSILDLIGGGLFLRNVLCSNKPNHRFLAFKELYLFIYHNIVLHIIFPPVAKMSKNLRIPLRFFHQALN